MTAGLHSDMLLCMPQCPCLSVAHTGGHTKRDPVNDMHSKKYKRRNAGCSPHCCPCHGSAPAKEAATPRTAYCMTDFWMFTSLLPLPLAARLLKRQLCHMTCTNTIHDRLLSVHLTAALATGSALAEEAAMPRDMYQQNI
eukprot:1142642-Pelagomonas_calceolata.AAC.5